LILDRSTTGATERRIHFPLGSPAVPAGTVNLPPTSKATINPRELERSVGELRGVGKTTQKRFHGLGIETVGDLLLHLPFRHESPSQIKGVASLVAGEEAVLRVRVASVASKQTARRRVSVLEALVSDDTGSIVALWYNQGYLEAPFAKRPEVLLKGVLVRQRGSSHFLVKRHEILGDDEESRHILGLVPVYPSTADVSVRTLRNAVHEAAPLARHLIDPVPARLLAGKRYPGKADAVLLRHFPSTQREAHCARQRLAFEELLLLQTAIMSRRLAQDRGRSALPLVGHGGLTGAYLESLPYELTAAQRRVVGEIESDLAKESPMRRLLHGDVGSGKTVVATYCLLLAVEEGGQAALMAPTEVLADQHYLELVQRLTPLGVDVRLLKGSQSAGEKREVLEAVSGGARLLVVGTHALIQEGVRFTDLRVAVVDEQHRFGVKQRDAVLAAGENGLWPHALHMSATPIPRTLSLTLYGDLDVSILDEMPPGRIPVSTKLVFAKSEQQMWSFVRNELDRGRQAYVVCPLIEESDSLDAAAATQTFDNLTRGELAGYRLRLLHGSLKSPQKVEAMTEFSAGRVDVLISTTVIEVGVDVPNATIMVIMGARRFGLSQLHQLRGRVGRGGGKAYCFLMVDSEEETVLARLALFARTSDGFALAEADLAARGEGQLFGERQSGLGDLQVASLLRDRALLEQARRVAARVLSREGGPGAEYGLLVEAAESRFGSKIDWVDRA
jgi:ATP-dependent DNA helicase RecG